MDKVSMAALIQLVSLLTEFGTWLLLGLLAYRLAGGGGIGVACGIVGVLVAMAASASWGLHRSSRRRRARALVLRVIMFGSAAVGLAALGHPWLTVFYVVVVLGAHLGVASV